MMREKLEIKAVKHPELLDLILIPFPFNKENGTTLLAEKSPMSIHPL
jgi:hypothetical protein